jgi:hypothetical protein
MNNMMGFRTNCKECLRKDKCVIDIVDGRCINYDNPKEKRVREQLNLYWACVELYCEHKNDDIEYNTKEKCHTQIRWSIKYINKESAVHLTDSNGNSRLYFELDSISFKTTHKKANQFINDALKYIADELGITVEELTSEAKRRMRKDS